MSEETTQEGVQQGFEGDYRPSTAAPAAGQIHVEPLAKLATGDGLVDQNATVPLDQRRRGQLPAANHVADRAAANAETPSELSLRDDFGQA